LAWTLVVLAAVLHFAQIGHFLAHQHVHDGAGGYVHADLEHAGACCGHHGWAVADAADDDAADPRLPRLAPNEGHGLHACGWLPPALTPCAGPATPAPAATPFVEKKAVRPADARRARDLLAFAPKHGPPASRRVAAA
jgi:hypothetical protein